MDRQRERLLLQDLGCMPDCVTPEYRDMNFGSANFMVCRWQVKSNPEGFGHSGVAHHVMSVGLESEAFDYDLNLDKRYRGRGRTGETILLRSGDPIFNRWRGNSSSISIHLPCDVWDELADSHGLQGGNAEIKSRLIAPDPAIRSIANLIALDLGQPEPSAMYCESLAIAAYARIATISSHKTHRNKQSLAAWRLRRVIEYIDSNFHRPLSVSELAAIAGLSRSHFIQAFHTAMAQTPHNYVTSRRISEAQQRLRTTHDSMIELAQTLGFASPAHFSAVFKRLVGVSPSEYRRSRS